METAEKLITENLDIWTSAVKAKSSSGRGSNKKQELYGIRKLRGLILELAVRGILVPQDPEDESPESIIEGIRELKNDLYDRKVVKKPKRLVFEEDRYIGSQYPNAWWVGPCDEISTKITDGEHATPIRQESGHYLLSARNVRDGHIDTADVDYVGDDEFARIRKRCDPEENDVLLSCSGSVGRVALVDEDGKYAMVRSAALIKISKDYLVPKFIMFALQSPELQRQIEEGSKKSAQANLFIEPIRRLAVPIPPLAEQHRIVAKVDELMALCDQLEQEQESSLDTHDTLVATLLGALTTATADASQFAAAWQRIQANFDTLFTTESSIGQLKQTILQLAVMGKLVPQDPDDEPASELLKKITKEKAQLTEAGKIKKQKPLSPVSGDEEPFDKPNNWEWVRLNDLSQIITKGSSPNWQGISYTESEDDVLFVTSENVGSFDLILKSKKYVEERFNELSPRSILEENDILMNIVGASIGRTAIFNISKLANINQAVCLIRLLPSFLSHDYFLKFFNSQVCVSYMYDKQVDNARANLSMGNIAKFVIPLPPLAEQRRIVAKVDELMSLCDALKASLATAQATQLNLADSLVEQAIG